MSRARHLLVKFGITEEQYDDLLRKQDGRCAVCNRAATSFRKRLAVDHDHKSGAIRGLLCIYCNRWIVGRHRRETGAEALLAAYKYLTGEYSGFTVPAKVKKKKRKKRVRLSSRRLIRRSRDATSVSPSGDLRIT